nr:MAG TPA: helix-turn-helix domain protein [Caudoviricetes sp.]
MGLVKYDNEQKKHLRENLKKFTEERGLAKTDLADKLGYAYNTVISWFNGSRLPSQFGIETLCDFFKVTDVELLGSPMKVRTFAYYRKDELTAVGSLQEIADQTGANVRTLRSLVATTKNLKKKTWGTYIIEIEDETRYTVEFKQTFTIDEIKAKNLDWLLNNPMVELKEVTG